MKPRFFLVVAIYVFVFGVLGKPAISEQPADEVKYTIGVGPHSGVTVEIIGPHADIIRIRRDGQQIGYHKIEDQPMDPTDIAFTKAGGGGNDWNIAARSGRDKAVFTCYAVRGNDVFNNKGERFRFGHHHDGLDHYEFKWEDDKTLRVHFGDTNGAIVWDANAKQWNGTGELAH